MKPKFASPYLLTVLFCFAATSPAGAQQVEETQLELGAALFSGRQTAENLAVTIGGASVPATRFACQGCHGKDGRGGIEGDVPSIVWDDLTRSNADRGAYDKDSFARAVTQGQSVTGRALTRIMPRYELGERELASLMTYLNALQTIQRTGISSDTILIGLPMENGGNPLLRDYAAAFEAALERVLPVNGVYGRGINLVPLGGETKDIVAKAKETVVAVVAPADENLTMEMATEGVPVLFPLRPMPDAETDKMVVELLDSWQTQTSMLAERIVADKATEPVIVSIPTNPTFAQDVIKLVQRMSQTEVVEKQRSVVLDVTDLAHLKPGSMEGRMVYGLASSAGQYAAQMRKSGARFTLLIENEFLLRRAVEKNFSPIEIHADFAAKIIVDALAEIGRDITRAKLADKLKDTAYDHRLKLKKESNQYFITLN